MKHAQVISTGNRPAAFDSSTDSVIAFLGDNVIDDTDQLPLGEAPHGAITSITVAVQFFDLMTGLSPSTVLGISMTYRAGVKCWTINVADIASALIDRHKYVGLVAEIGSVANMRTFHINEFAVDNDSFEASWMRMGYQIEIGGGEAWMVWYEPGHLGTAGYERYKAPAYQGGAGTAYATDPALVTHRGAIVPC